MSYCAEVFDSCFSLSFEKSENAKDALRSYLESRRSQGMAFDLATVADLTALLGEVGLEIWRDGGGEYDTISFPHGRYDHDLVQGALAAIAPYVEKGSYIVWRGEDGSIWVNAFDGVECLEKTFCDFGLFAEKMISSHVKDREVRERELERKDVEAIAEYVCLPDPSSTSLGTILEDILILTGEGIENCNHYGEIDDDIAEAAYRQLGRIRERINPESYSDVTLEQVFDALKAQMPQS